MKTGYRLTNGFRTTRVFPTLKDAQKALTKLNKGTTLAERFGVIKASEADVAYYGRV